MDAPNAAPAATQETLDRIESIRAKAESLLAQDPNHPEGLAFEAQYFKLLSRYQLDPERLGRARSTAGDVIADQIDIPGTNWASKREALVSGVLGVFKVPHIIVKQGTLRCALVTGVPTTLETAKTVCAYLMPQLDQMVIRAKAHPTHQGENPTGRRLFVSGALDSWLVNVLDRLAALYREAETEAPAATGKDLAVIDKAEQLAQQLLQFMKEQGGATRRTPARLGYYHQDAHDLGRAAAASTDLGQTATGGSTSAAPRAVGA